MYIDRLSLGTDLIPLNVIGIYGTLNGKDFKQVIAAKTIQEAFSFLQKDYPDMVVESMKVHTGLDGVLIDPTYLIDRFHDQDY